MKRKNEIIEFLEGCDDSVLINLFNEVCSEERYFYKRIYHNDETFFNENFSDTYEAVRAIMFGKYEYSHKFIRLDGYANIETTDNLSDWVVLDDLAMYIADNDNNLFNEELKLILEKYEEE